MRRLVIASVALIGLSAGMAYAGEGNGDPFPGPDAAVTSRIGRSPYVAKDQDPYQFRTAGVSTRVGSYKLSIAHDQDPYQFRVVGSVVGSPTSAVAAGDQSPTATNVTTQAATPHS